MKNFFEKRKACPACDSEHYTAIVKIPYSDPSIKDYLYEFYSPQGMVELEYLKDANYELFECNTCGCIFQRSIPNKFLMHRIYSYWINAKKKSKDLSKYTDMAQEIMAFVAYFKKKPQSLNFFDFGLGWASWALMAKAFGCNLYGAELSNERIAHAKANGIKMLTWSDIPTHSFDLINTEQVFEHIAEPLMTLKHLKAALSYGGVIKISVPSANDIDRKIKAMDWKAPKGSKKSLNAVAPLEHINCFRRKSLLKMASKAGLKEVMIPLALQYRYRTDFGGGTKHFLKTVFRPIYRDVLKLNNYILLTQK